MKDVKCPVCNSNSNFSYTLEKKKIINELEKYWQDKVPSVNNITDYDIFYCPSCTTEFANPLVEGDSIFYEWITRQEKYYSSSRWEFFSTISLLNKKPNFKLLDVGCGDGKFLKLVQSNFDISKISMLYGIDKTLGPLNRTQDLSNKIILENRGVDDSLIDDHKGKFDFITLFHVLEHVSNPDYFISVLLNLLTENGKLIISTPNSPMTFEKFWFDIMNHPPHHMLRLNRKSYESIAKKYDLKVKFLYNSNSIISDFVSSLKLKYDGSFAESQGILKYLFLSPFIFFRILFNSLMSKRSNTILVVFSKK
jgi:2-polyprenyl-3-methyl-5-hydroxy-6-metoxy-1,4-benzoquinol methylase